MNRKHSGSGRRRWLSSTTAIVGAVPALALSASIAYANPQGGTVTQGSATITQTTPKTLTINQSSDKAVINWQSFSIGQGETTRFNQPSASSVTLNRVTGNQVSQILGTLSANGRVFLVNPNGILFGNGAQIDVAALTATTHGITDQNFMAGNFRFDIPGKPNAQIINQGTITAADGGLVALVAPSVRNSGIIQARLGRVALAGANGFTLDLYGDNLILFQASDQIVKQITDASGTPVASLVENDGKVYADGGTVLMTADVAKGVVDSAVNMTGLVSAKTVAKQNGDIILDGGNSGVEVAGTLDASGQASGQTGGQVTVKGDTIALASASKLDASGDAGGGKVTVGSWQATSATMADSAAIDASAETTGNGGAVSVISDTTNVAGTILAKGGQNGGDGGQVETSGHFLRVGNAVVDTSSKYGKTGTWLLDPTDFTIASSGGDMTAATLVNDLANSNVTILSTSGGTSGNGDIFVNQAVTWNSSNNLILTAYRNIQENSSITPFGTGSVTVNPGTSGTGSFYINGTQYTLISTAADLGNISLSGHYAVNADFSLGSWTPIGYVSSGNNASPNQFTGVLEGQGHTLSNLSINDSSDGSLGLISSIGSNGIVRNIRLSNASMTVGVTNNNSNGIGWFGPLAGVNYGTISNTSSSNETIVGASNNAGFGGLVGWSQGTITDSFSTGTMTLGTTTLWSGGLLGYNHTNGGVVSYSYSSVNISASGGAGLNGNVGTRIGGLAGENAGSITDSYATGSVSGGSGSMGIGGLVGLNNNSIANSYATGSVSGGSSVGGLVGWIGSTFGYNGYANNSFCNTSSAPYSCGQGTGLNTAGMQTASHFSGAGWSTSTWTLADGAYPKLSWSIAATPSSSSSSSSSTLSTDATTTQTLNQTTAATANFQWGYGYTGAGTTVVGQETPLYQSQYNFSGDNESTGYVKEKYNYSTDTLMLSPGKRDRNTSTVAAVLGAYGISGTPTQQQMQTLQTIAKNAPYAMLANNAYYGKSYALPPGYTELTQEHYEDPLTGFSASVFMNKSTGEVTIAFRGTDNAMNIAEDAGLSGVPVATALTQGIFNEAMTYAQGILGSINGGNPIFAGAKTVDFTGHSLGGGLAAYVALQTNGDAITFDPSPIPPTLVAPVSPGNTKSNIINFRSDNDPLTTVDGFELYGNTITVSNANVSNEATQYGHSIGELAFAMNNVSYAINNYYYK